MDSRERRCRTQKGNFARFLAGYAIAWAIPIMAGDNRKRRAGVRAVVAAAARCSAHCASSDSVVSVSGVSRASALSSVAAPGGGMPTGMVTFMESAGILFVDAAGKQPLNGFAFFFENVSARDHFS